jgi:hypothetical protein
LKSNEMERCSKLFRAPFFVLKARPLVAVILFIFVIIDREVIE